MDQQQDTFYSNILFCSCLFLDPRFKNILDEKYLPEIIDHLSELYFKIMSFKSEEDSYEIGILLSTLLSNRNNFA